jgi:formylglycine-generating enzyme required for sulfatase activity
MPLDRKLKSLVRKVIERAPMPEDIATAGTLLDDPSPAMLEGVAQWLGLLRDLESLTPRERLDVFAFAVFELDARYVPSAELWERDLDALGAAARPWALDIATRVLAGELPRRSENLPGSAAEVLVKFPGDGPSADELIALATYYAGERAVRTLVAAASPAARAAWLKQRLGVELARKQHQGKDLREALSSRVEGLLPMLDLCGDAACRAELAETFAIIGGDKAGKKLVDRANAAMGGERQTPARNEQNIAAASAYAQQTSARVQAQGDIPKAIAAAAKRAVTVLGVVELADLAKWKRAKPARRAAIAQAVAAALGDFTVAKKTAPGGLALLEHRPTKHRFALIPGGTFAMGLGKREEATIRAAAKQADKEDNYAEQFGALLERVAQLRPVRKVRVAPFLLACKSTGVAHVSGLVPLLAGGGARARLPSEAEWEYAARGGVADELTPQGNAVPTAPKRFTSRFGLDDLGHLPEICADAFAVGYAKARDDAAPRAGKGPRVVRGGAAYVYPWQSCGEWQLLCNAIRTTTQSWDDEIAVRLAIGLTV